VMGRVQLLRAPGNPPSCPPRSICAFLRAVIAFATFTCELVVDEFVRSRPQTAIAYWGAEHVQLAHACTRLS